jgi:hypothetical protein
MVEKKRKTRSKKKDVDINIKINDINKLAKCNKKECWKPRGTGFWGFGAALAMVLSYVQNSSIVWAIVHGILSWFYVIYRIVIDYGWFK